MARRGRKRKAGVARHPNGRVNQRAARIHVDETRDNIEARQRVYDLTPEQALAMPEANELGRLRVLNQISPRQYEAGTIYRSVVHNRNWALALPSVRSGSDLERVDGAPGSDVSQTELAQAKRALARWDICRLALDRARRDQRAVVGVVDGVILRDRRNDKQLIALRVGLNRLADALRLPDGKLIVHPAIIDELKHRVRDRLDRQLHDALQYGWWL